MTSLSISSFVITFFLYSRLYTSLFDDDKTAEQDSLKGKKRVPSDATTLGLAYCVGRIRRGIIRQGALAKGIIDVGLDV